jgi:hypothetical protein
MENRDWSPQIPPPYLVDHLNDFNMVTNQLSYLGVNFDDVIGVILSKEMRWESTSDTSGNALVVETRGR